MPNTTTRATAHRKLHRALFTITAFSMISTASLGQPHFAEDTSNIPNGANAAQGISATQPSEVVTNSSMKNPFTRYVPLIVAQAAQPGIGTGSTSNSTAGSVLPTEQNSGTVSGKSSVRALVGDTVVTTKIKAAMIADPGVKAAEVSVETNSGEVTLSGAVDSQPAMEQAEKIAKGVTGVKAVVNNLTLKK